MKQNLRFGMAWAGVGSTEKFCIFAIKYPTLRVVFSYFHG